jgi:predicted dehydrogenase
MTTDLNRRRFLQKAGAGVAGIAILSARSARTYAANDAVNMAIVGVGGQGGVNRNELKGLSTIVALCDADKDRLAGAAKEHAGARPWTDYRKMLQEQKGIDAVMVSTPDHLHAPAAMLAIRLGKAVDVEKPMTHNVHEARILAEAALRYKVATMMDNEGHSFDEVRRCAEWLQAGTIGPVREAHIWTDRPIWPQGIAKRPPSKPVPANLEWDLWLGPAPVRDYHDHLHPFAWRGWWDFGTGALGDMGCHWWDAACWGLNLGAAKTCEIEAEQEGMSVETAPNWSVVTCRFPARPGLGGAELPPVKITWWDGKKPQGPNLPPKPESMGPVGKLGSNGAIYVGEKATIVNDHHTPRVYPEAMAKDLAYPKPFSLIPKSPGHKQEWIAAIRGGPPGGTHFPTYGSRLCEIVLLGNLALRAGRRFEWDFTAGQPKGCPEAAAFVRKDYRKGWEL